MFTNEQDIERELNAALKVAPSSDFEARVLREVDLESRRRARPMVAVTGLAAAAAVLLAIGAAFIATRTGPQQPAPAPFAVQPEGPVAGKAPERSTGEVAVSSAPAPAPVSRRQGATARPMVPAAAAPVPDVIVPQGQLALIRGLVRDANAGRRTLPEAAGDISTEPAELVVPPLVIEPVAVAGTEPGGGVSRGPKGLY